MKIWIDADGCPVVKLTIEIAKKYGIPVEVVKNYAIQLQSDYAIITTVDVTQDAADFYITANMLSGDLVITSDYGLSAMVIGKKGHVMQASGDLITNDNIDFMLERRHAMKELRQRTGRGTKHKKRTSKDNCDFERKLTTFLQNSKS